jgi:hypothetical protein
MEGIKRGLVGPKDYTSPDDLFYAVNRICANVGKQFFLTHQTS